MRSCCLKSKVRNLERLNNNQSIFESCAKNKYVKTKIDNILPPKKIRKLPFYVDKKWWGGGISLIDTNYYPIFFLKLKRNGNTLFFL